MKKLLMGATLVVAALASTQLLADPAGHRHGQSTPCAGANCPAATTAEHKGQHGMGHGGMQAMHGEHQGKGASGNHGMRGAQRGNAGKGCPMHAERKPT